MSLSTLDFWNILCISFFEGSLVQKVKASWILSVSSDDHSTLPDSMVDGGLSGI